MQIDFCVAQSQATPKLLIDPFANCIFVPGEVARQTGTIDVYVQPSTVTIVTELFLVQAAVLCTPNLVREH